MCAGPTFWSPAPAALVPRGDAVVARPPRTRPDAGTRCADPGRGRRRGSSSDQRRHLRNELLRRGAGPGAPPERRPVGRQRHQPLQLAGQRRERGKRLLLHRPESEQLDHARGRCRRLRRPGPADRDEEPAHHSAHSLDRQGALSRLHLLRPALHRRTVRRPQRGRPDHLLRREHLRQRLERQRLGRRAGRAAERGQRSQHHRQRGRLDRPPGREVRLVRRRRGPVLHDGQRAEPLGEHAPGRLPARGADLRRAPGPDLPVRARGQGRRCHRPGARALGLGIHGLLRLTLGAGRRRGRVPGQRQRLLRRVVPPADARLRAGQRRAHPRLLRRALLPAGHRGQRRADRAARR